MTAIPASRPGWELLAGQVNQRRYEALRAYLYEGLPLREAADATGYTRAAVGPACLMQCCAMTRMGE